jgi:hypothetical protein
MDHMAKLSSPSTAIWCPERVFREMIKIKW